MVLFEVATPSDFGGLVDLDVDDNEEDEGQVESTHGGVEREQQVLADLTLVGVLLVSGGGGGCGVGLEEGEHHGGQGYQQGGQVHGGYHEEGLLLVGMVDVGHLAPHDPVPVQAYHAQGHDAGRAEEDVSE